MLTPKAQRGEAATRKAGLLYGSDPTCPTKEMCYNRVRLQQDGMMTRDDLLAAFGDEHHRLLHALDGLNHRRMTGETLPGSEWTVQDILGNIVAWEEYMAGAICHLISNPQEPLPLLDYRAWRAEQVASCRRRPLAEVMSQMYRVRQETCALVAELTDEELYAPRPVWLSDRIKNACGGKPITIAEILEMFLADCRTYRQAVERWRAEHRL